MWFFYIPQTKCKRYPEGHWTDLIGFVCCGYGEKITSVFMLYVLRRVWCNWLWLYLINEFTTNVSALKLCKTENSPQLSSVVVYLSCFAQNKWEAWVGRTDRKTHNPRPPPPPPTPPDAVWFSLYLCDRTSLSITHESMPYTEWEELKHSLHLRHCDVSEAFMKMFKREHPIGLQSMILALLTVTSCNNPNWGLACSVS